MTRAESCRQTDVARAEVLRLVATGPQTVLALRDAVQETLRSQGWVVAWLALQSALKELRAEGRVKLVGKASGTRYTAPTVEEQA